MISIMFTLRFACTLRLINALTLHCACKQITLGGVGDRSKMAVFMWSHVIMLVFLLSAS